MEPKANKELYESSYQPLIEGLNTSSTIGRFWVPITLVKWSAFSAILVFCNEQPSF